jgi:hypothetical protein
MAKRQEQNRPRKPQQAEEGGPEKIRVPAEPIPQRPGEAPVGNGGTEESAAFPPHN